MLDRIVIEGLFGQYDYDLPLVHGRRKNICFLTGPNGYGKSTILQLIYAFLKSDARTLASIIFGKITFYMKKYRVEVLQEHLATKDNSEDDGSGNDDEQEGLVRLTITVYAANGERMIERSMFTDDEIGVAEMPLFPPTLSVYLSSMKVEYVKDDRLWRKDEEKPGVSHCVEFLQRLMSQIDNQLISLYNARVVRLMQELTPDGNTVNDDETLALIRTAQEKLTAYNRLGMATTLRNVVNLAAENSDNRQLYMLHLRTVNDVLDIRTPFYLRLNLLYDIIVRSEFSNKRLVFDTEHGLYFVSGDTIIIPESLSSGEQHFIIQLIMMIFKADEGALILIDEPELSYHPAWQMDYLKNLRRIAELGDYQFILATHSAQIFDYRWSYTIDLYKQTTDDAEGAEEDN